MLTVLRLTWGSVDDLQWAVVRASLHTAALAPHGCLSWHSRRSGGVVQVSALWDDQHGAQIFRRGLLLEVAAAARLDPPVVTQVGLTGMYATGPRPTAGTTTAATTAATPAATHRQVA